MEKYSKVKQIGEGSFGKALLVRHKESGKQLVIKEINMTKMSKKEREDARKETAVLAQLLHPNIVAYRESFEEVGNLYIVMDYCDGGDLYSRINHQRGILFKEDEVLDWFVQTCLAIKHIHDRKILHRDIKSQNIFLTRHGIVKLGDFGIAKVLNSTVELARTCIGTPYYLSPEIVENRPYNNKSDIWSLGCVLYELSTLKHAFEAGNMKNLVLKIIRGSYPPPSPRYSYELRNLINSLFKRSARDRPSINTVLKKPLLQSRIKKFLSESELNEEFSHTALHGVKIKKALPPGGHAQLPKPVLAKRPPPPSPSPSPAPSKYNPASVYAPSVARKSAENRRSADGRVRKSGSGNKKPIAQVQVRPQQNDLAKRRQELLEKERKRREEAKKKEAAFSQQLDVLADKQRVNRIKKAREEGWRNLVDSLSSTDDSQQALSPRPDIPKKQDPVVPPGAGAGAGAGKYEHYHEWLRKLEADKKAGNNVVRPQPRVPAATPMGGVAGALGWQAAPAPVRAPALDPQDAAMRGQFAGAKGADAAERARLHEEFYSRRQAAAANRARGGGEAAGVGVSPRVPPPAPKQSSGTPKPSAAGTPKPQARPVSAQPAPSPKYHTPGRPLSAREQKAQQEEEYLARLRQIRLQNFNERRAVKDKVAGKVDKPSEPKHDSEERKKKIEALRAQANDRAKKLREELDRRRRGNDKHRPSSARAPPAPGMTEAMQAIGAVKQPPKPSPAPCPVGMTAAMAAIGASVDVSSSVDKSPLQKKKEEILKRLNQKPPADKPKVAEKPQDRPKWGEPVKPAIAEAPDKGERGKWGEGKGPVVLSQMSLEETGSHMEATNIRDSVIKHDEIAEDEPHSARKHWGGQAGTVMNILKQADLKATNNTVASSSEEAESGAAGGTVVLTKPSSAKAPVIGSTITIGPSPAGGGGTVVIKRTSSDDSEKPAEGPGGQEKIEIPPSEIIIEEESQENEPSPAPSQLEKSKPLIPSKPVIPTKPVVSEKPTNATAAEDIETEDVAGEDGPTEAAEITDVESKKVEPKKDEGKALFDKVELKEDENVEDEEDLTVEDIDDEEPEVQKKQTSLQVGLTTGHFDIAVTMLRTCSEPDLSKLFRTNIAENPFFNDNDADMSLDLEALRAQLEEMDDEEDDNELADIADDQDKTPTEDQIEFGLGSSHSDEKDPDSAKSDQSEKSNGGDRMKGDDQHDDDEEGGALEDDSDSDMQTMRESMMSLLEQDDPASDEELTTTQKKKKGKKSTKKSKKVSKKKKKDAVDGEVEEEGEKPGMSRQWSNSSVEDFKSLRETMKSLLQPESVKPKLKTVQESGAGGDATSVSAIGLDPNTEAWQDDDDDGDDDFFEEEDMFSRLEESREKLEEELGCDTFLKAYKTVQNQWKSAIHEDEDENMEEGMLLVSKILGNGKAHLYQPILQLVMADGAFTEDNV